MDDGCQLCGSTENARATHRPTICRKCHTRRNHHYRRNRTRSNREKVIAYLQNHPCVDCGEVDWVVLQFDHRVPAEKERSVADMVSHFAWERILAEIAKCDVRCANCHTRKTALEFEFYAYLGNSPRRDGCRGDEAELDAA